jgi:DNA-binding response OmpR family regulator/Tfp pilus assembly protein PilZ
VTPANVFVSYDGRVKLADFGVASIAAAGRSHKGGSLTELVGNPGYFAPEQLAGEPVDQRGDLFSLGVMMFEMLTGAKLFAGDTADDMLRANKRAKIPRPSSLNAEIPGALEAVLLKALEKRPDDRFTTARDMLRALNGFVPPPVGMSLAVAALMRKVFLTEHIQELQLREGLTGVAMSRGSGQSVAVCSTDDRAQAAFNELLSSRGYRPTLCPTLEHVSQAVASTNPPLLVLADVCSRGFSPAQFVAAVSKASRPVAVVAVSDGLSAQWIHYADAIGAVDLLFKPFNIERVLTAVRAAISGTARVADIESNDLLRTIGIRPHLLVVSRDADLALRLTRGFSDKGFEVEVVPSANEALERTDAASYHLVVYDSAEPTANDRVFAAQYRSRPAMGLVPVVYLTSPDSLSVFAGIESDRGAVRPRTDAVEALADLGHALLRDNRLGRVFVRYAINLPVELRYGGRVFNCQCIDVSRGGIMLRSDQMPPVGTEVGVALKVPGVPTPVEVAGRVTRVDLPTGGTERRAGLGVEFERFAGGSEPDLIGFLRTLDPAALAKRTVILSGKP